MSLRVETPADLQAAMRAPYALSEQQWRAVSAPLRPSVVIAGAGSGKTTLMAARVVHLVLTGQVRPEQVLGLTFTTKAAAELRGRINAALTAAGAMAERREEEEPLEPTVLTYNAYAANLLTEHGLRIGHEPDTRVITDASRYQLGARAVERFTGDVQQLSDHPPTVIQNLLALDGAMTEHLVEPPDVRRTDAEARRAFERAIVEEESGKGRKTWIAASAKAISAIDRRAELLGLVETYRRLKRDFALMDFADQIALAARLAADQPEVGGIERGKYAVVLLDEYQDTSVAQALMLSRLFSGPSPEAGRGHPVTAVGDPQQAIYGWRGASVSNIVNFAQTFPTVDGTPVEVLPLTVNRRSERRILEVANKIAEPLMAALPGVRPLEPKNGAGDGEVSLVVHESQAEELADLVRRVRATHDEHDVAWSDIGVLTRDNSTAEATFDVLTADGIPVEIVGLSGLLRLPEVAEVVATLSLLHDVTDNASLLTLLTGPRWSIGPRDLKLLGERARELSGGGRRSEAGSLEEQLVEVADGVDPAELPALTDALEDPGEAAYSAEALDRFALLAAELRMLRAGSDDPVLDLVRRIVDVTGVDVELASSVSPAAAARRDNLDLFVKAVADFQAIDGQVTLAALLAYLTAEDDAGNGLDLATPSAADSVKLLTVHRSKGLEWEAVFCVGMTEDRFPSKRGRTLWTSSPAVLPAPLRGDADDLPQLAGFDKPALDAYRQASKDHEAGEERRLAYVALTRAAHRLHLSAHLWGERVTPYGPSEYQAEVRDLLESWGSEVVWLDRPAKGSQNPVLAGVVPRTWPVSGVGREAMLRREAAGRVAAVEVGVPDDTEALGLDQLARVAEWDEELDRLLAEARRGQRQPQVRLPESLSATALARLREDPEAFARDLVRPMPRPPSPAARFGTRFHAWVESRFGQQGLLEPDDLPGRGDTGIDDDADLAEVTKLFAAGPFGDRVPVAVEAPFALVLAGQVVRGRIDAVYDEPAADGSRGFLVVDWKTNREQTADPLQLAIYRLAWAELNDVPVSRVRAAFHYVRSGATVEPDVLADREDLERIVSRG